MCGNTRPEGKCRMELPLTIKYLSCDNLASWRTSDISIASHRESEHVYARTYIGW